MKEGDTYTLDPEEVTCPTCRPRRVEQCACYEYVYDNPDCPVHKALMDMTHEQQMKWFADQPLISF